jgi:excinuclease ABC subunit C
MPFDPQSLALFPKLPGVYIMKNGAGEVIYVGKAKVLKARVQQYFSSSNDSRAMIPFLLAEIDAIDTIVVPSEKEALLLESTLIKQHKPKYNAVLKDDKSYISLMINNKHPWPSLKLIRYKGKPKERGLYFGPYTSAYAARQTYDLLLSLFPLRQCSDEELKKRKRPCILYSIKRCCAPCVNFCSKESYDEHVQQAIRFLKGQNKSILDDLHRKMEKASSELEYEKAALFLKTIRHIEHVTSSHQSVVMAGGKDSDVLGLYREGVETMITILFFRSGLLSGQQAFFFSHSMEEEEELITSFILQYYRKKMAAPDEIVLPCQVDPSLEAIIKEINPNCSLARPLRGEKKKMQQIANDNAKVELKRRQDHHGIHEKILLDMQETFKLCRYPKRIECIDTSHSSGSSFVATLLAFDEGERDKARTRHYHIKQAKAGDDYAAMHEVLTRRLSKGKDSGDLPDLIIVDGGKGQLGVALSVLKELDIACVDIIALTKEESRHDKGMTKERVFIPGEKDAICLPERSSILFFLQRVRDLTHEKVLSFHRKTSSRKTVTSILDSVPGIGPLKKKRLLAHFKSVKKIIEASDEELLQIKGLTIKDIKNIKQINS